MTQPCGNHLEAVADFIDWLVAGDHLICRWHPEACEWKPINEDYAEQLAERFLGRKA